MNLSILQIALNQYISSSVGTAEQHAQALQAAIACCETRERQEPDDNFDDAVSLISDAALLDILNVMTYDVYGKAKRIHGVGMRFGIYAYECRRFSIGIESFTNAQLMMGYDYIKDLWADNEATGDNRPDGTFNTDKD